MLLTVLFGELLTIMILLSLLQFFKIKWLHVVVYLLLFVSLASVGYYLLDPGKFQVTSSWPFIEKVNTVKADFDDRKSQVSAKDFEDSEKDYDYVTFTELQANNSLYRGKFIDQWGKVKKVIASDKLGRKLILDLDESQQSSLVVVNYHLSDLAKGIPNVKKNDHIKVFGEGGLMSSDDMPVIEAHFINKE